MNNINTRVLECARSFLGTPFHIQGRQKGIGIDCVGLVVLIGEALGFRSKVGISMRECDTTCYTAQHGHSSLIHMLDMHLEDKPFEAGSIAVLENAGSHHLGFIGDYRDNELSIIHACMKSGCVVEHRLTPELTAKVVKTYGYARGII